MDATLLDVVPDDADVLVAVGPGVLVPEADHMTQFMHHNPKLIAVLPNGDGLRASPPPPHVGAAPVVTYTHFSLIAVLIRSPPPLPRGNAHPQGR